MGSNLPLLNRRRRSGGFSPTLLFASGEQGAVFDANLLATLSQDTAGTTSVTTPGQTTGLALSTTPGLVLGSEVIVNGGFDTDTDWVKTTGWTISGGAANYDGTNNTNTISQTAAVLASGRFYRVSLTVTLTQGALVVRPQFNSATGQYQITSSGTYSILLEGIGGSFGVLAGLSGSRFIGSVDNVSVRELPGFHATQATLASRPTYGIVPLGGRRNLLTRTEEFNDAVWTKTGTTVTANAATDPIGGTSADKLVSDASTGFHRATVSPLALAATNHTFSVYMKAAEYTFGGLSLFNGTSFVARATFDLAAGTVSITDGAATITSAGNSWYLCTVTGLGNATITPYISVNSVFTFAGTAGSGILIWGAQLETGSSSTAYQRVGSAFDVTQAGVASVAYLSDDGGDSLNWSAPAGTYTVARVNSAGTVTIQTAQALSGATDMLLDAQTAAYVAVNRALSGSETELLTSWLRGRAGL